jgi:hypothetical protein
MSFANLSLTSVLAGLAGLAAALFVLQQLRTRYRDLTVVTTMFWRQVVDEAPVRRLRERFRHPWAYALLLLIVSLIWIGLAEPAFTRASDRTFYVLVLDGSAGMAAGTRFEQAVDQIVRQAARLPRSRREVIWSGAEIRPLLAPGEDDLLLRRRLEGRTPEAAPASVERLLRQLSASRSAEPATSVVVFGGAPVRRPVLDLLPSTVTVTRAAEAPALSGNTGITSLGVSDAASGAWDRVDVFVDVRATPDRPSVSATDVRIDLDGQPIAGAVAAPAVTGDGHGVFIADVPAAGGLLTVRLPGADSLSLDNAASVRLPAKPIVKVQVSAALAAVLGPVLDADRGLLRTDTAPDVVIRRAGDPLGAGAPALEFVPADAQPQAFLLTHPASLDSTAVFSQAVAEIGLNQIDAMSLAQSSGRAIEVSIATGPAWRCSVWEELLSEDYDFTRSRAFPVFVANAVRWLAGAKAWYPYVAAGRPLSAAAAGARAHILAPNGRALDAPGVDVIPAGAGPLARDGGAAPLAASLLDPEVTAGARDAALPATDLATLGAAPEAGLSAWLLLAAIALLAWEWHLYQRGRLP